ncbi:MAG TPA: molybdopterin-dependent oxidoreductase [Gaiellaceae bacterium]|nr:molybdopterin-dependent oxidoreductase [Gaiellaceae bacterium]
MDESRPYGRRAFLAVTLGGLSALWWAQPAWRALSGAAQPLENALPPGLVPSGWRIYTVASTMPRFDPATWRLRVEGRVAHPVELDYRQLRALPRAEQVSTFHCVTGWSVKNVHWAGVRFRDLLEPAGPLPDATTLTFVSAEVPYVDTLTLAQARLGDAMLAYEMDGKPLPREHGAPARVVIPEMYGYKNVKWVSRIVVGTDADPGYWEQRGYDVDAWVGRSNGF